MPQTAIEKITQAHAVDWPAGRPVRAGDFVKIRPAHCLTHDNTSAVLAKFKGLGASRVADPRQPVFALDHNIQDTSEQNLAKYRTIEEFAAAQGIVFHPAGRGIGHQVMIEEGFVRPGGFVVASDSHSNMYGALGALGTPIVRTDAAALWATGTIWWQVPHIVKVVLTGELPPGSTGKDLIITLCGLYNQGEVLNAALEFAGSGVGTLSIEERLSIANMTTEWGALVGWFPVDERTLAWLGERVVDLATRGITDRLGPQDIERWREDPPRPDADAVYSAEIELDLGQVLPHVSGPDSVQVMSSLAEMASREVAIQKAYIVSCVNSRQEDLAAAAAVLRGKSVAEGVELYVAAASAQVEAAARASGDWDALLAAGARPLPPGCGPCIGLGTGLLEPGEVGISATNRNFKGRMGSREAKCYLASPAVVAASAVAGHITGPVLEPGPGAAAPQRIHRLAPRSAAAARSDAGAAVEILPGFPERIEGRGLWVPADNLNTDGIYGKDYTYRDDMTPEMMAKVVMANYDPAFAGLVDQGDILVGGYNFGTGSSREQAATALQAAGIACVIAGSFSQTYLRNAINNGFICLTSPDLVETLRESHADDMEAGRRTLVLHDAIKVDIAGARVILRGVSYACSTLGRPVQEVVLAGGLESLVRQRLAGDHAR